MRRKSSFTLIELLVVIAIMGIVMGIMVGSPRLLMGSGVDAASRMVSSQLSLARQYAISQRRTVAVLFPDSVSTAVAAHYYTLAGATGVYTAATATQLSETRTQLDSNFSKSVGFCFVTSVGGSWTFAGGVPNTKWEFLPSAAAITEVDDSRASAYNTDYPASPDPQSGNVLQVDNVPFPVTLTTPAGLDKLIYLDDVKAIIFKPNGSVANATAPYYVTVAEYVTTPSSTAPYRSWVPRNRRNWATMEVNPFTGKAVTHHVEDNP